jgi:hypothetical protein
LQALSLATLVVTIRASRTKITPIE